MEERSIGVYVTNLRDYTNGTLNGEWVRLPCSKEHMKEVFGRLRINNNDSECFITDYEVPMNEMYHSFGEFESLDDLNYLAALMDDMSQHEYEKFENIVACGINSYFSAADYINLSMNIDNYQIIPAENEDELGRYVSKNIISDLPQVNGIDLTSYIDYEAIGRDYSINAGGNFGKSGFVESNNSDKELFCGVPDKFKVVPDMDKTNERQPIINEAGFVNSYAAYER